MEKNNLDEQEEVAAKLYSMAELPTPIKIRRDNRDKRREALPIGHLANSFGIYSFFVKFIFRKRKCIKVF